MAEFQIRLFGETRVIESTRVLGPRGFGGIKPRQVLEVLALNAGQPVTKETLVDALWGERAPNCATATLEAYVSVLRRRLEPGIQACASVVQTVNGGYRLDPDRAFIDIHEFRQLLCSSSRAANPGARSTVRRALEMAQAELLASNSFAPWAIQARSVLNREIVSACERASAQAAEDGQYAEAISLAQRALTVDPLAEPCARTLIEALWRDGRRAEALRAYDGLRRTLADELGADPDPTTRDLYLTILRSDEHPDLAMGQHWTALAQLPDARPPATDQVQLERLVNDVVRTVGGLRVGKESFVLALLTRISGELIAT